MPSTAATPATFVSSSSRIGGSASTTIAVSARAMNATPATGMRAATVDIGLIVAAARGAERGRAARRARPLAAVPCRRMDLRRLRAGEWIAAVSGAAVLASLFLPWYDDGAADLSGWEALGAIDV